MPYNEEHTKLHCITPALLAAGWSGPRITMEYPITAGQILVHGDRHRQLAPKKADYLLRYTDSLPFAMVEELQIRRRTTRRLLKFSTGRIREIEIPLPSIEEQRWAVAELEAVQSRVRDFQLLQESSYLELQALMPAVLDQAFRGKL